MVPLDLAAEVSVLGRAPLSVQEFDVAHSPSGAPRMGLGATFLLPSAQPVARPFVELRLAGWHADYDTELPYDATVLDLGGDLGFRVAPFAPSEIAGAWAPRPFLDFTLGVRLWPLLHPWWDDELFYREWSEDCARVHARGQTSQHHYTRTIRSYVLTISFRRRGQREIRP